MPYQCAVSLLAANDRLPSYYTSHIMRFLDSISANYFEVMILLQPSILSQIADLDFTYPLKHFN